MRAKKFGVTSLNDETKKLARAERFGSTTTSNSSASIKLNVKALHPPISPVIMSIFMIPDSKHQH